MKEEILKLTKEMVAVPSVNSTTGEKEIGIFIEKYLRNIPYFKKHPELVVIQKLKNDTLERRNVFALLRGEKEINPNTIIFHGHTDTVGVEDYGTLQQYAFDCERLKQVMGELELSDEVRKDLESGDYLFGRGACDMKSGDAVFLVLVRHIAEHISDFSGNILLSFNPVEENLHTGIIEGIEMIETFRKEYQLHYVLAVNNDYICPMYPGDTNRYIYTGVGGKLLPCFFIQGQETHVGQCFEGYDPTLIAADLAAEISYNTEFCDEYQGEYSLPPVALKLKDLKGWYNVQTAKEAFVYFNYFVHKAEIEEVVEKFSDAAWNAVKASMERMNERYRRFCTLSGKQYTPIENTWEFMTYQSLYETASKKCEGMETLLWKKTKELIEKNTDKREIPISIIRFLLEKSGIYHPVIVLYFGAPYCPHNTLRKERDEDAMVLEKIRETAAEIEKECSVHYELCHFFPSLSDSSYLAIDDSENSITCLKANFPQMDQLYPLPLSTMKNLGIPAVNFGVYGKDAHKWTERLYMPYSFEVLPKLLQKTIEKFL